MQPDDQTPLQRLDENSERVKEIIGTAVHYGLTDWLDSLPIPGAQMLLHQAADDDAVELPIEVRIRMALADLGPTFIKIGQVLSTRVDIIGPQLAEELTKLQMDTPADSPEVVATMITSELKQSPCELFAEFENEAYASASIAQVHRAVLFTGEVVAVKVQKAGIQTKIESDLSILEALAQIAEDHSQSLKDYGVVNLTKEFRRSIFNELDFNRERQNIEKFRANFATDPTVHFPLTWPSLSSRRVLTMEYMEGPLGNQLEALCASGGSLDDFACKGAAIYLNMIFRDGFYHADPHPGNMVLLENGVVGIIDCGMVGRVDEGLRGYLESLVGAITQEDVEELTDNLWSRAKNQPEKAKEELRADLTDLLADSDGSLEDVGKILNGLLRIFQKYHVNVRPGMPSLLRTIVLLDGTARRLNPEFNLKAMLEPYQDEALRRRMNPGYLLKRFERSLLQWDTFIEDLPGELSQTMHKMRTGELRVELKHRHLDAVTNRLVLGIVTAAVFLGSCLLWSLKAAPLFNGVSIFGALGYCTALILAWNLYRAIKNSGKVAPQD